VRKSGRLLLPALLLVGVLVGLIGLAGCRPRASAQPGLSTQPDSVRIEIDIHLLGRPKPSVTLTDTRLVQQLYATVSALPTLPEKVACTDELGPHYTLTFLQSGRTLSTALARREGCSPVTIAGETSPRRGSAEFWAQLDWAIYQGTPPATTKRLAIVHTADSGHAPQTALITATATVQRLYAAILALPLAPTSRAGCATPSIPAYQLVFQATNQAIPADIYMACDIVSLQGAYQSRGGVYAMDDHFKQVLAQVLAGATFAPAQPDQLTLDDTHGGGTSQQTTVADAELMQRLYQKVVALQPMEPQPDCPSQADKLAGTWTRYLLNFSQWGLPIVQIEAYEGSCSSITRPITSQVLRGDQAFWDLVHHAAGQK
jgi:hypothetical protein